MPRETTCIQALDRGGLAPIFGLLTATLNGGALGRVVFHADSASETDIAPHRHLRHHRFTPLTTLLAEVDRQIAILAASERMDGIEAIRIPDLGSGFSEMTDQARSNAMSQSKCPASRATSQPNAALAPA